MHFKDKAGEDVDVVGELVVVAGHEIVDGNHNVELEHGEVVEFLAVEILKAEEGEQVETGNQVNVEVEEDYNL